MNNHSFAPFKATTANVHSQLDPMLNRVEADIDYCFIFLSCGQSVELDGNLQNRFGDASYGKHIADRLSVMLSCSVTVTGSQEDHHTLVRLTPHQQVEQSLPLAPGMDDLGISGANHPTWRGQPKSNSRKNPPRPMNCWLLYRDARYKELKSTYPHLTVHEIFICSQDWKKLSETSKDEWRARAKHAKEQHQRQYPEYKYAPRKPGQKKKRQSHKLRQRFAKAMGPSNQTMFGTVFSTNITGQTSQLACTSYELLPVLDQDEIKELCNNNEQMRHAQLEAEFGDFAPQASSGDDVFAFYQGPMELLTMPTQYSSAF